MPDPSPAIEYDVVGVGNALVDVIGHADDGFIAEHGLVKGSMTLVETDRAVYLYKALGGAVEMSGGSAANTICGVASLGGRAACRISSEYALPMPLNKRGSVSARFNVWFSSNSARWNSS